MDIGEVKNIFFKTMEVATFDNSGEMFRVTEEMKLAFRWGVHCTIPNNERNIKLSPYL